MAYKITGFIEHTAQLGVWFEGAPTPEWLWLPISDEGELPTGQDLEEWILSHKPTPIIERQKLVNKGIANLSAFKEIIPVPEPVSDDGGDGDDVIRMDDKEIAEQIRPAVVLLLKEFGLLKAD